jgi:hypothetical protein
MKNLARTITDKAGREIVVGTGLGLLDEYHGDWIVELIDTDETWGFIDMDGTWVVPPIYERVYEFSEGLAQVKDLVTGRIGFINTQGEEVIACKYDSATGFSEGFSRAYEESAAGWSVGVINTLGDWVIKPGRFEYIESFSQGLASAKDLATGLSGFIDITGSWIVEPIFDSLGSLSEDGLAVARLGPYGSLEGYVDRTGSWVIEPRFNIAWGFSEGFAVVKVEEGLESQWGHVDKTGEFIRPPCVVGIASVPPINSFNEGLALTGDVTSGLYGFIDTNGGWAIEPQFVHADDFRNGLAAATIADSSNSRPIVGFVDTGGAWVLKPQFVLDEDHLDISLGKLSFYSPVFSSLLPLYKSDDNSSNPEFFFGYADLVRGLIIQPADQDEQHHFSGSTWLVQDLRELAESA